MCQWFLDRMDGEWLKNKDRFIKKINLMHANFCTTEPKSLKFSKYKNVFYMPIVLINHLKNLKFITIIILKVMFFCNEPWSS